MDGDPRPGAIGLTFSLDPVTLSEDAMHTVSITVHDPTPWVHPANAAGQAGVTQTLTWVLVEDVPS